VQKAWGVKVELNCNEIGDVSNIDKASRVHVVLPLEEKRCPLEEYTK
jgi:hypothetical protein